MLLTNSNIKTVNKSTVFVEVDRYPLPHNMCPQYMSHTSDNKKSSDACKSRKAIPKTVTAAYSQQPKTQSRSNNSFNLPIKNSSYLKEKHYTLDKTVKNNQDSFDIFSHVQKYRLFVENPAIILFTTQINILENEAYVMLYNDRGHYLLHGTIKQCIRTLKTIPGCLLILNCNKTLVRFVDNNYYIEPKINYNSTLFDTIQTFPKRKLNIMFNISQYIIEKPLLTINKHDFTSKGNMSNKKQQEPDSLYFKFSNAVNLYEYLRTKKILSQLKIEKLQKKKPT